MPNQFQYQSEARHVEFTAAAVATDNTPPPVFPDAIRKVKRLSAAILASGCLFAQQVDAAVVDDTPPQAIYQVPVGAKRPQVGFVTEHLHVDAAPAVDDGMASFVEVIPIRKRIPPAIGWVTTDLAPADDGGASAILGQHQKRTPTPGYIAADLSEPAPPVVDSQVQVILPERLRPRRSVQGFITSDLFQPAAATDDWVFSESPFIKSRARSAQGWVTTDQSGEAPTKDDLDCFHREFFTPARRRSQEGFITFDLHSDAAARLMKTTQGGRGDSHSRKGYGED